MTDTPSPTPARFRRRYMMATTAIHKLGDISREQADLCVVEDETAKDYIGRWVAGFGFINVRFPKETTRELSADEIAHYDGKVVALNGEPIGQIHLGAGATKR